MSSRWEGHADISHEIQEGTCSVDFNGDNVTFDRFIVIGFSEPTAPNQPGIACIANASVPEVFYAKEAIDEIYRRSMESMSHEKRREIESGILIQRSIEDYLEQSDEDEDDDV